MPKDVVLSTKTFILSHLTILIVGLLFFGGLYYILYEDQFRTAGFEYLPVTTEPVSLFLEITNPEDDVLSYEDNILISGKTSPELTVIIADNEETYGLQAGKDGQFSRVLSLEPGAHFIEITAFDLEGNTKTVSKSVYYSEEEI